MLLQLLMALAAPTAPGPVFVRIEVTTAHSCPRPTCDSAGELRAGEKLKLVEIQGDWGKVSSESGTLSAWAPLNDLAAGVPESRTSKGDGSIYACPKGDCKVAGAVKKGDSVLLVSDAGDALLVRANNVSGYLRDKAMLEVAVASTPKYIPPAVPPKYIPPDEKPKYIPPAEKPRYIPADSPAVYIPPAQPASMAKSKPPDPNIVYVRIPSSDIHAEARAASKADNKMPGGAKLYVKKKEGDFIQVGSSDASAAPPLGWIAAADVRNVPPMIYKLKAEKLAFHTCQDAAKCPEKVAKGLKAGDQLVVIDEATGGAQMLVLLPGQKDSFGWVKSGDLEPGS